MKRFEHWLLENETPPKKPAMFKQGDKVIYDGEEGTVQIGYSKARSKVWGTALCEVEDVYAKSGKWFYSLNILEGSVHGYERGGRSSKYFYSGRVLESPQKNLSAENVQKLLDVLKDAEHKRGDKVTFKEKTHIVTQVNIDKTLESGEPMYVLGLNSGQSGYSNLTVSQSEISPELIYGKEEEEVLVDEILKVAKIETESEFGDYFKLNLKVFDFSNMKGKMHFRTEQEGEKFLEDLKKFIESREDATLRIVVSPTNQIEYPPLSKYDRPQMNKNRVLEIARKLKIDIQDLFSKKKGRIGAKKLGII